MGTEQSDETFKARMLKPFAENLFIFDGPAVPFAGMPFTTRMSVAKLSSGDLWVHSPSQLNSQLLEEIDALGRVEYLVSPNKLHHLFLKDWMHIYPQAVCYSSPGLAKKRKDIEFTAELEDKAPFPWSDEIEHLIFTGSPLMQEVVFFHRYSETLILTDLIENFDAGTLKPWQRVVARLAGILAPDGKTPLDWRLSFCFSRTRARRALNAMLAWKPRKIVIAHGECIRDDALDFLAHSFSWL